MAFGFVRAPQLAETQAAGITLLARLNALRRPACYDFDRMVVLAELWAAAADQGDLLMVKVTISRATSRAPLRRRTALTTGHMMGGRSFCAPLAVMGQTVMTQSLPRGTSPWRDTSSVEVLM